MYNWGILGLIYEVGVPEIEVVMNSSRISKLVICLNFRNRIFKSQEITAFQFSNSCSCILEYCISVARHNDCPDNR
jgi:hypothetical protein